MFPSISVNSEQESNPILYSLYLHLSGSAFLVNFKDPDKQIFNVKSEFNFLTMGLMCNKYYIYIYTYIYIYNFLWDINIIYIIY